MAEDAVIANQPIVIDNGSGVIKAGFAGGEKPRVIFPSCVGRTKHRRVMPGGELEGSDFVVGDHVGKHRGILKISYPMEHGVVTDWQDMERVWKHIYSRDHLHIPPEEHPVLRSGGAVMRIFVSCGASLRTSLSSRSPKPGNNVLPPLNTI